MAPWRAMGAHGATLLAVVFLCAPLAGGGCQPAANRTATVGGCAHVCVPLDAPGGMIAAGAAPPTFSSSPTRCPVPNDTLTCCGGVEQDVAADMLLRSLAGSALARGGCPQLWRGIGCKTLCSADQGRWIRWQAGRALRRRPALVFTNATGTRSPSPRRAVASCHGRCCDALRSRNSSCCEAIERSLTVVSSAQCIDSLMPLLYASYCEAAATPTIALCANYSRALYRACANETAFGSGEVRRAFGNAENFVHSMVPAQRARAITVTPADGQRQCIAAVPLAPVDNSSRPLPWEICGDAPSGWVNLNGQTCPDFAAQQLCTSNGGYGPGWIAAGWGTFTDTGFTDGAGISATAACCVCGGGAYLPAPEPEPEPLPEPEPAPGPPSVDWGQLLAPDGYEYRSVTAELAVDSLVLNLCTWFCKEVGGNCSGGNFSGCGTSPVQWLRINVTDTACFAPCPSDCHARGSCYNATTRSFGPVCTTCEQPYFGSDCGLTRCPRNCAGHGQCDTSNGTCTCSHGYDGHACEIEVCPQGCSRAGTCNSTNGMCTCIAGREGLDCTLISCPDRCSGFGVCDLTSGTCSCNAGKHGANCALDRTEVYQLIPPIGPRTGGTVVHVHASHFAAQGLTVCRFTNGNGAVTMVPAVAVNSTVVACTTPPQESVGVVIVHVVGASVSNPETFRYYEPLSLIEMSPYFGEESGGTNVSIRATYGWTRVGHGFMPTGATIPLPSETGEECRPLSKTAHGTFVLCGSSCVPRQDCATAEFLRCRFTY
eukprot:COSAG01_NODE_3095_length_6592_cov_88.338980_1_plen_768_part_10